LKKKQKIQINANLFVTATAFDANHCAGSIMILFQGYFGNILHTGDFRFHEKMLECTKLKDVTIDILYLDTTYANPKFNFPSQENALVEVKEIVEKYPNHRIVFGLDSLGKEELVLQIARMCNDKVRLHSI
jgi:DNA cross-link repair 1B protein